MNLHDYTFVALDLETTGLDPNTDTIIEIAAVRFHLEKDGESFRAIHEEVHTMLIDPGRKLEENIAMITGIDDDMLVGKEKWGSIQEKVEIFIGNSIIVGHNVLFDVAMLSTHGIDLSRNVTLDTFELSEIFSQESESLNLGFLGKKYGIFIESEHRALDDTKLSIELFCLYLGYIAELSPRKLILWNHAKKRDQSHIFSTLLDITGSGDSGDSDFSIIIPEAPLSLSSSKPGESLAKSEYTISVVSLSGNQDEEKAIIESYISAGSILILTPNQQQSLAYQKTLLDQGYSALISRERKSFISIEMLSYWLKKPQWERKESILILKLCTWIEETPSGLLDELKFYGEERDMIGLFRSTNNEENFFYQKHRISLEDGKILIAELSQEGIEKDPILSGQHCLMIRDIMRIEDVRRKKLSYTLSFGKIFGLCESLSDFGSSEIWEELITGLSILSDIYSTVVTRPVGPNPFPPGEYGETYFISQKDIWHRGSTWLILASNTIEQAREKIEKLSIQDLLANKDRQKLLEDIDMLIKISFIFSANTSIIVSIKTGDTKITYIPRDVREDIQRVISTQKGIKNILCGYGIFNTESKIFLEKECGISEKIEGENRSRIMKIDKQYPLDGNKIVLLTTSLKHIRMLAQELRGKHGMQNIFAQGLSGGKGKMLSLFQKASEKSILIGLIDTWIDEGEIWYDVENVIIAKVPFDPPTDPYFLARTVGMKNNFEEYSTPIALSSINTLIGRIHSAYPEAQITCVDDRINTMNWGKVLQKSFL